MAAAQAASATALAEREAAVRTLSRRTTIGLVSTGGLTVAASGLAWWGNDAERRFREAQREAAEAVERAIDKEAMRTEIQGRLLAFAAAPDQHALDGPQGGNSPYTQAMMEELADERSSFQAALSRATRKVLAFAQRSNHNQRPFLSTDLNGEFYLFRRPATRRLKAVIISTDRVTASGTTYTLLDTERDTIAWEKLLLRAGFEVRRLVNPKMEACQAALDALSFEISRSAVMFKGALCIGPGWYR